MYKTLEEITKEVNIEVFGAYYPNAPAPIKEYYIYEHGKCVGTFPTREDALKAGKVYDFQIINQKEIDEYRVNIKHVRKVAYSRWHDNLKSVTMKEFEINEQQFNIVLDFATDSDYFDVDDGDVFKRVESISNVCRKFMSNATKLCL